MMNTNKYSVHLLIPFVVCPSTVVLPRPPPRHVPPIYFRLQTNGVDTLDSNPLELLSLLPRRRPQRDRTPDLVPVCLHFSSHECIQCEVGADSRLFKNIHNSEMMSDLVWSLRCQRRTTRKRLPSAVQPETPSTCVSFARGRLLYTRFVALRQQ